MYAIADVLYRALRRTDDLNLEKSPARVLRESILDDLGRTLDILHGLLGEQDSGE